jgi:hypothetical protein
MRFELLMAVTIEISLPGLSASAQAVTPVTWAQEV